jgi:hypothetical protein
MPTLSASDYTRYLKLKSAATSYQNGNVPKSVQTTDQVVPVASILNAEVLASQAAFVVNPRVTTIVGNARVSPRLVPQLRSNPDALSTVSYAGTSGALGPSAVQRPGGLPSGFKSSTNTYTRLPQNAGWSSGVQTQL